MIEPKASRPRWPDALQNPSQDLSGLKPWPWALELLEKSHNYWIATSRPAGRPHLMLVWGIWWQDAFWFSTGPRTRKAKNIAADPHIVIGTEKADEAVILEGTAEEIKDRSVWKQLAQIYNNKYGGDEEIKDRSVWKQLAQIYNNKYGGDVEPILMACDGCVFRVTPQLAFGQGEHANNFTDAVTRWNFPEK